MIASPLQAAIAAAGGSAEFIRRVNISPRSLASWRKSGVPDTRWQSVAAASGGAVSVAELALERASKAAVEAA